MLLSHGRYVLLGMAIALAMGAGGVLARPGGATAQPQPTLVLSPSSGPCDATVEVRGEGFEVGAEVPLDLARPNTDDVMGRLATASPDSNGRFSVRVDLGNGGCEAAALHDRLSSPGSAREIEIYAGFRHDVLFVAARARYGYTTTAVSGEVPQSLPSTGQGSAQSSGPPRAAVWVAVLAAGGLLAFALSIYAARRRA
jgi:hypothetical protein